MLIVKDLTKTLKFETTIKMLFLFHGLIIKYLYIALNIKLTVVNRKDVDVNERERLSNFTNIFMSQLYTYKQIKVKEQLRIVSHSF
jgi:hypothetical protein